VSDEVTETPATPEALPSLEEHLRPLPEVGRCMKCRTIVPLDETFKRDDALFHRIGTTRRNLVGTEVCGPVAQQLAFHVYAVAQEPGKPERTFRTFVLSLMPPEEDMDVLTAWERHLERERAPKDAEGKPLAMAEPITVVVTRWALIGART
jgi:hypothetical protein